MDLRHVIQTDLLTRALCSITLWNLIYLWLHLSILSRLRKSVNKTPSEMLSETVVVVKTQPINTKWWINRYWLLSAILIDQNQSHNHFALITFHYSQSISIFDADCYWRISVMGLLIDYIWNSWFEGGKGGILWGLFCKKLTMKIHVSHTFNHF